MENNIYQAPQADLTAKAQGIAEDQVTPGMVEGLEKGGKWAKFLAILGYIIFAFLVIAILFMVIGTLAGNNMFFMIGITVVYAVYAFIIFKMSRFLHQYSAAVKALTDSYDPYDLIESQEFFARYIKWMAIIIIIGVILALAMIVIGIAVGGMALM